MKITPFVISLMFDCHVLSLTKDRWDNPATRRAFTYLLKEGLVEFNPDTNLYEATDKGRAWVRMICNTPFPRMVWVDQNGNQIEG